MIISKEEFKIYISLNTNDFDDTIGLLVSGAVKWVETMIDNIVAETQVEEYFDGDEIRNSIYLTNNFNIQNLVIEYESNGNWVTIPNSDYVFYDDEGSVKLDYVRGGEQNYKVTYKVGYTNKNIPADLKLAILKIVGRLWNKRKSDGIKMENLGDASVSWENYLSPEIAGLLSKYKKFNV